MSALPPKADIGRRQLDVRFVPKADSCAAAILSLVDHSVGAPKQRKRYGKTECLRGFREEFSIDRNFKFDAAQQLRAVACFNFSLFHFCHTLVNSSSRPQEQTEQIL
jgi:hypothetical protein